MFKEFYSLKSGNFWKRKILKAESEDTPKILKSRGSVNLESKLGVCRGGYMMYMTWKPSESILGIKD